MPLKTYLPDGDIDLTALSFNTELKETWATDLHNILKKEEQNADAEFRVKEVQYINADVRFHSNFLRFYLPIFQETSGQD